MEKTIIPNHKPQAYARGVQRKNDCQLKYFVIKGSTLEVRRRTVTEPIAMTFATRIPHSIKVLVLW